MTEAQNPYAAPTMMGGAVPISPEQQLCARIRSLFKQAGYSTVQVSYDNGSMSISFGYRDYERSVLGAINSFLDNNRNLFSHTAQDPMHPAHTLTGRIARRIWRYTVEFNLKDSPDKILEGLSNISIDAAATSRDKY